MSSSDGQSTTITPNTGPTADLRVASRHGRTITFCAQGSHDADGRIVRYHWTFGDGHRAVTTVPRVAHRFSRLKSPVVTLPVVDDERCSTRRIFTGVYVACGGWREREAG